MTETILGERYRLEELIGRGGMASVWRATDTVLGRPVAIKRLHAGLLDDDELAERFRREALLVARLSHPNLVRLLDRGEDPERPYLVLELVEGENLKSRIRREGALPPAEAARICAQVGRALAYAHGQGVVHRDIKGQNVLLARDGPAKLADFGIARLLEGDQPGLTRTDMLVGSADYLSPEQADGRPVDARANIYSLGIVLYECLTRRLPFVGEGFVAVAMKHCSEPLPDPRELAPDVPAWLATCAVRAAAKEPDARFPDAEAMVAALEGRASPASDGGTAVIEMPPLPEEAPPPATSRPRRGSRRRRALVAVLVTSAAAAVAALLALGPLADGDAPAVAATELGLSAVRDYDPEGDDGVESPELRGLAADDDPTTAWYTERYASETFGGLKSGVGLLLRLLEPAVVTEMALESPTPGARFEVRGPLREGGREVLAEGVMEEGPQVVRLQAPSEPAQTYLLWITSLVPDESGRYWAGVGQVELRGAANVP